jgi:hypothetical protein
MKRIILIIAMAVLIGGAAFGQTQVAGLLPKDARSMGMGGAFRVFSTGYNTFFGNPAGFASKKGSLTIADVNAWAYVKPTQANIDLAMGLINGGASPSTSDMITLLGDFITKNGLGAGASVGLGWAGRGFGLGATLVTDEIVTGSSLLGASLSSQTQANGIIGLAFPIQLGFLRIQLGVDARAFYILKSPANGWTVGNIATAFLSGGNNVNPMEVINSLSVFGGYGFATDAGLTIGVGPLMLGAMVRDFGLQFNMDETSTVGDLIDTMMVPTNGTTPYALTPVYAVGAAITFDNKLLAPSVYAEIDDPVAVVQGGVDALWNKLHAGAELKLLNFISARAGLNKGWLSLGAGLDLLFLKVNAAVFTEEMGASPGDLGRTGISVDVAVRF